MAKGLRSKILRKHKAVRRADIYGPVEDARRLRLDTKIQAAKAARPEMKIDAAVKPTDSMEIDSTISNMSKMEKARLLLSKNQVCVRACVNRDSLKCCSYVNANRIR